MNGKWLPYIYIFFEEHICLLLLPKSQVRIIKTVVLGLISVFVSSLFRLPLNLLFINVCTFYNVQY